MVARVMGIAAMVALVAGCAARLPGGRPRELPPVTAMVPLELGCGKGSPAALAQCVEVPRLAADAARIRVERTQGDPRSVTRALCEIRLAELGFETTRDAFASGVNVIGRREGVTRPKEQVLLSARHTAADDGCGDPSGTSGVAALFEAARILGRAAHDRTLGVACWDDGDEAALGSASYARRARERGDEVIASLTLDGVASFSAAPDTQRLPERFDELFPDHSLWLLARDHRADFLLVVTDDRSRDAAELVKQRGVSVGLPVEVLALTERMKREPSGPERRAQASFWDARLPGILLTDTGPYRAPEGDCSAAPRGGTRLDFAFTGRVTRATVAALAELVVLRTR